MAQSTGEANSAAPQTAKKKRRTRTALIAVAILAVLAGGSGYVYLQSQKKPAGSNYRTATVTRSHLVATVSADGSTKPIESTDVYPAVSGTVKRLDVKLGDTVTAGDTLYVLDRATLQGTVLQARATLDSQKQARKQASQSLATGEQSIAAAQATLLQANQNLDALESKPATTTGIDEQIALAKKQRGTAQEGLDAADASYVTAEAGVNAARSNLKSAQDSYDTAVADQKHAVVTAPVDGVITTMDITLCGSVSAGSGGASAGGGQSAYSGGSSAAGIVISETGGYKARVDVSESQRPRVKVGQPASVTFNSLRGQDVSGTVTWIAPVGTNTAGVVTYEVDVTLGSQPQSVSQGMSATARIVTDTLDGALAVPSAAVKVDGQTKYVVVLLAEGTTKAVVIKTGVIADKNTEITSGVNEGDTVVLGAKAAATGGGSLLPSPGGNQ